LNPNMYANLNIRFHVYLWIWVPEMTILTMYNYLINYLYLF